MILRFGKWKDYDTADPTIPVSYLKWLEEQDWVREELRFDLNQEIEKREGNRPGAGKVIPQVRFYKGGQKE